jgi:hypothetical protein
MGTAKPIYERLSKLSTKKLDDLEYQHLQHFARFKEARAAKSDEIQRLEKQYNRLVNKARKEMVESLPLALGTAMLMRQVKADILVSKSIMTLIRSSQFFHRLMVVLTQDTKAQVEYNPERINDLIPAEFEDMVGKSIFATNLEGLLGDLKQELENATKGGE